MKLSILYKHRYVLYIILAFLYVLAFSFNTSPFYLGYAGDASIYKQMGILILQGGIPYIDLYDNKGLLLYLFNAFGLWINTKGGICLLQSILMAGTLIVWDKILYTIQQQKHHFITIFATLLILLIFYEGGDMTEDLSLLFISLPLLYYFKAIYSNKKISTLQYFIVGICFGIIAFIRINNVFPFIFFYIFAVVADIINKNYKSVIKNVGFALIGLGLIACLTCSTMVLIGGFSSVESMFYWMFGVNFERLVFSIDNGWDVATFIKLCLPITIMLCVSIPIFRTQPQILIPLLAAQIPTICSCSLRPFPHYAGILIPLYLIILGKMEAKQLRWLYVIILTVFISLNHKILYDQAMRCRREVFLNRIWFKEAFDNFHQFTNNISDIERQRIFNFEAWPGLSLLNSENIIQYNHNTLNNLHEEFKDLTNSIDTNSMPRWLITTESTYLTHLDSMIISQHYTKRVHIGTAVWKDITLLGLDLSTCENIETTNTNDTVCSY